MSLDSLQSLRYGRLRACAELLGSAAAGAEE